MDIIMKVIMKVIALFVGLSFLSTAFYAYSASSTRATPLKAQGPEATAAEATAAKATAAEATTAETNAETTKPLTQGTRGGAQEASTEKASAKAEKTSSSLEKASAKAEKAQQNAEEANLSISPLKTTNKKNVVTFERDMSSLDRAVSSSKEDKNTQALKLSDALGDDDDPSPQRALSSDEWEDFDEEDEIQQNDQSVDYGDYEIKWTKKDKPTK